MREKQQNYKDSIEKDAGIMMWLNNNEPSSVTPWDGNKTDLITEHQIFFFTLRHGNIRMWYQKNHLALV